MVFGQAVVCLVVLVQEVVCPVVLGLDVCLVVLSSQVIWFLSGGV